MISRLIAALALASAVAPPPAVRTPSPSYTIAVTIDPATRRLEGRARILWRNATARPTDEIQLHCYYNAVQAGAMVLTRLRDASDDRDLLAGARGRDGTAGRESVVRVPLARAIEPDGELVLDAQWTATVPGAAATDDVVLAAQWFPQLAVLTDGGWIADQDVARSYVFADAGAFDVTIDAPTGWNVAASGVEEQPAAGARGRRFVQADATGFAFAIGRAWIERRSRLERSGGDPIDLRLLLRAEHRTQADRMAADVHAALVRADSVIAPYPYASLTIVDLPWRSPAEGTVAPAFLTVATRWIAPARVTDLETALARALARHAWQAVVSSDRVATGWLVDGLSSYAALRLAEPLVQRQLESTSPDPFVTARFFGGFLPYPIRAIRRTDTRGARALQTLERYVGWPTFETMLGEYGRQFRFAHPTARDFERVAESVSGRDLRWFFDEALGTTRQFDYAIASVRTDADGSRYRTTVTAARAADGVFSGASRPPIAGFQSGRAIEIATTFADGTLLRDVWDGRARTATFAYESAAPVASVTIDPDRVLVLDAHRTNNSWTARPTAASTAVRWSAQWMTWLEHLLLTYGLLV